MIRLNPVTEGTTRPGDVVRVRRDVFTKGEGEGGEGARRDRARNGGERQGKEP